MSEERAQRHVLTIVAAPLGNPFPDWMLQRERAAFDEPHDEARCRNHLCQRREIEERVCVRGRRFGIGVEPAERLPPQDFAGSADFDDRGWKRTLIDAALHDLGCAGEVDHGAKAPFATVST